MSTKGEMMSQVAVTALRSEHAHAVRLMNELSDAEWSAPSGCVGWRVQDVFCHMASVFHSIADPSSIDGGDSPDVEQNAEVPVQARKSWTRAQVIAEYTEWSEKGIGALTFMNSPEMADTVIPLSNLGSHPMHLLANAIVFDHYCHLRHDVGHSVPAAASLPRDESALAATLEWMLAGIPQMCEPQLRTAPRQSVNLVFEGPAGGSWILAPGADLWTVTAGRDSSAPSAISNVHDFISWGTKRASWRDSTRLEGENADTVAVLDAINVI